MRRGLLLSTALAVAAALSCKPKPAATPTTPPAEDGAPEQNLNLEFGKAADQWLDETFTRHPYRAVEVGLHEYDGMLPDVSETALTKETQALEAALQKFEAFDPAGLEPELRVERGVIIQQIRADLFEVSRRRQPWTNPMYYLAALDLAAYISREYAPLPERAAAITRLANGTPQHLRNAMGRLEAKLPRTFVDTALLQVRGTIEFVEKDVRTATAGLTGKAQSDLDAGLAAMAAALKEYEAFLVERRKTATDDFALGAEMFVEMLRETQGFDVSVERLRELGQADLDRNFAALEAATKALNPKKPLVKVVAKVTADKPATDGVLAEATQQSEAMRKFLLDKDLITIPSEDVAEVRPSPPFMRWNSAFLSPAGVFEKAALPSFYYISPPDPAWPKKQQQAYVPGKTDLLFITIHEVWPGHFLHGLHIKANRSRVLKSSWNYAMGEGWAHYTEEMMWDAGVSDDPAVHVGQLQNALLRNVRYLSAIGLHTGEMTVEQSFQMFRDKAFQDDANARQQAARGTFDPMYLSYTLGKLAILKLRDDVKAKWEADGKTFSLKDFHDALLSYGAAPLPVIREAMLGPDAGPIL